MTADRTRFHSTRSSESRSKKSRLLTYSTIIITNRSPIRVHEITNIMETVLAMNLARSRRKASKMGISRKKGLRMDTNMA